MIEVAHLSRIEGNGPFVLAVHPPKSETRCDQQCKSGVNVPGFVVGLERECAEGKQKGSELFFGQSRYRG